MYDWTEPWALEVWRHWECWWPFRTSVLVGSVWDESKPSFPDRERLEAITIFREPIPVSHPCQFFGTGWDMEKTRRQPDLDCCTSAFSGSPDFLVHATSWDVKPVSQNRRAIMGVRPGLSASDSRSSSPESLFQP